jgi:hypothetical protein
VFSISGPLGTILSLLLSRQVIRLRGQRLKGRLVALILVSLPRHRGGVGAIIDLNESVDSSVDAFCHPRKIRPQPPISKTAGLTFVIDRGPTLLNETHRAADGLPGIFA